MKLKLTKKEINILLEELTQNIDIKHFQFGIQSKRQLNQIIYKLLINKQKKQKIEFTRTELAILLDVSGYLKPIVIKDQIDLCSAEKILFYKLQFMLGSFVFEKKLLDHIELKILRKLILEMQDEGTEFFKQSEIYEFHSGYEPERILLSLKQLEKRELLIYTEKGYKLNEKYFGENNET